MKPKPPPDRRFGVIVRVFAALARASDNRSGRASPWMRLAGALHRLVGPLVLWAVFYLILTPVGALQRFTGGRAMRRKIEPKAKSYWIRRQPPGPSPESLRNEF